MLVRAAAAGSPFYRDFFKGSGIDPGSIRTLDDLAALPILDRSDLVEGHDRFLVYPRRAMWTAHSSGTSGQVVTVYRTPGSSAFELSALERQWGWFGLPSRPRRVLLRRNDPDLDGTGAVTRLIRGSSQLVVSSYRLDTVDVGRLVSEVRAFEPEAVEGWPSSIATFAALLQDRGERLPVRGVIASSEMISTGQRELIDQVFDAPVIEYYGQVERVCMAGVCPEGGYHEFPDYGIIELLPVDGQSDRWEIVGTPLHNWGFPLFRYRTGDQVGPRPAGPCACGRHFPLLGAIDGRKEDAFTGADGRRLPMPHVAVKDLEGTREVQLAQLEAGRFEVRLVPGTAFDFDLTRRHALENVEAYFGTGQTVTFRLFTTLPRSPSGKLKSTVVEGT